MADEETPPEAPEETEEGTEEAVEVPLEFGAYKDDGSLNPAYGDPLEVQERVAAYREARAEAEEGEDAEEDPNPPESPPEAYVPTEEEFHNYAADEIVNQPQTQEPGESVQLPEEPDEEGTEEEGEGDEEPPVEGEPYDPGDHTVNAVQSYVEAHPDEAEAVLASEEAGKNRSTLTSWLHDFIGT